MAKKIFNSLIP